MKKNFLLLCGLLLSVSFFAACSDDNTNTPAPEPSFPELVTLTAEAGDVIEISFDANYDWTATISEETYTYFQLLSGETAVNTLTGVAGEQTIKVQVADVVVYENAPVADVTLTMNDISKVIATISYPVTEREVAVYAPVLDEDGAFDYAAYGSEFKYAYAETAMIATDVIAMQYGRARGMNYSNPEIFYAPVSVEANFAYTLVGPEWMEATEAGVANKASEFIIKADMTKIPADYTAATIGVYVAGSDVKVAEFQLSIGGYANYFGFDNSYTKDMVYAFTPAGDYNGWSELETEVVANNPYVVIVDAEGTVVDWITPSVVEADSTEDVIKTYTVSVESVSANTGASRKAYMFCFANEDVDCSALFNESGEISEDYEANFVTSFVQYPEPGTITSILVDDTCASFGNAGSDVYIFDESNYFDAYYLGESKYEVRYFGEYAEYASAGTQFQSSAPIVSFKTISNDINGSLVEIAPEQAWVWATAFNTDETSTKFKIEVNLDAPSAADAELLEWDNTTYEMVGSGEYEAVILAEFADGGVAAIYFNYNANTAEESEGGLTFRYAEDGYPDPAAATLVEQGEMSMLYYQYCNQYPNAKIYELTYFNLEMQSMNAIDGLEGLTYELLPSEMGIENSEWLSYNSESGVISMTTLVIADETYTSLQGAIIFKDENNVVKYVVVCTLALEAGDGEGDEGDEDDEPETIDWDYVCGAYQITEWSSPYWNTDATQRFSKLGYGFWYNYVKLASDCTTGADKPCGTPKDGQRYGLIYSYNNHAFFDISSTEIDPATWEPKEGTGCYALINMIDREDDKDHIENNYSYYDKNEEAFYISFTLTSGGTVYRHDGKMHSRGTVDIKEPK